MQAMAHLTPSFPQVQGMSFIAAVLILNLDTADAFIAFSNLLNKPCQMAFFRVDHGLVSIPCAQQEPPRQPSFQWKRIHPPHTHPTKKESEKALWKWEGLGALCWILKTRS